MPAPDSRHDWRKSFSLTGLQTLLAILFLIIPAVTFLAVQYNLQDIYWKDEHKLPCTKQPFESACYHIFNNSPFKSPPLKFTFTVDVPRDKVHIYDLNSSITIEESLSDPNHILLINLCVKENSISNIVSINKNSAELTILRDEGLGKLDDTLIKLYWQKDKYIGFSDNANLFSGISGSPNYKIYPHEGNRTLWKQIKYQIMVILAVFLIILLILLFRVKGQLDKTKKEVESLTQEIEKTKEERAQVRILNLAAYQEYVAKMGREKLLPPPKETLPVEEEAAREYRQKTEVAREGNVGKQKSPKDQAARKSGKTTKKKEENQK
jgi:hypothetical protein